MQKSTLLICEKYKEKVQDSQILIENSYDEAYQDAVHIEDKEYLCTMLQNTLRREKTSEYNYCFFKRQANAASCLSGKSD